MRPEDVVVTDERGRPRADRRRRRGARRRRLPLRHPGQDTSVEGGDDGLAKPFIARVDGRKVPDKGSKISSTPTPSTCTCSTPRAAPASADRRPPARDAPDLTVRARRGIRGRMPSAPAVVGSPPRTVAATKARMALEITAARADPALLDLPVAAAARGVAEDHARRPAPRHLAARRAVRAPVGPGAGRQGDQADLARREYELLRSLNRLEMPCVEPFAVVTAGSGRRRAARRLPDHPAPAVLAALPRAVQPEPAQGHRRPADRRARRAARAPAPRRVLVGRRVAVEHAVPARRRRVRRLPRRRRDRRAARAAQRRPARARPGDRPGQHRRRADGPRGRRAAPGGPRPGGRQRADHAALPRAVGRPHRQRADRRHRALAGRATGSGGSTPSASTSTSSPSPPTSAARRSRSSPRSSTPGTTPAGCCGSPVSTCARTRPAGCSTTSTPTRPRPVGRARTRRSSRTTGWPPSTSR